MKYNSMSKKVICLVAAASILSSNLVYATEIKKDESVFVTLNEQGSVKEEIVSDWLHSDEKNAEIKDKSILKDIKNIKGDEKPSINGDEVTWKMNNKDIYYSGTTDKKLPLEVNVNYFLDGNEISPKDLPGKSGNIKIKVSLKNTDSHETIINGNKKKVYTPLTTAVIVNLPLDTFSNINVDHGQIMSEGNNNIVSFIGFPGMKDSLALKNDYFDDMLSDEFEITASVNNFDMGPIFITATPKIPEVKEFKDAKNSKDLSEGISKLKDAANQMYNGINSARDGSHSLRDGLFKVKNGTDELNTIMNQNEDKIELLTDDGKVKGARTIVDDGLTAMNMDTSAIRTLQMFIPMIEGNKDAFMNIIKFSQGYDVNALQLIKSLLSEKNMTSTLKLMNDADSLASVDTDKLEGLANLMNYAPRLSSILGIASNMSKIDTTKVKDIVPLLQYAPKLKTILADALSLRTLDVDAMKAFTTNQQKASETFISSADKINTDKNIAMLNSAIDSNDKLDSASKAALKTLVGSYSGLIKGTEENMKASAPALVSINSGLDKLGGLKKELDDNGNLISTVSGSLSDENIKNISEAVGSLSAAQAVLQDPETQKALDAAKVCLSSENVEYYKELMPELLNMEKDVKDNASNIETIKKVLTKADPKTVQSSLAILDSQGENISKVQKLMGSLTPEFLSGNMNKVQQLLNMQQDLKDNEKVLEVAKDALSQNNVDTAKKLIASMPELTEGINKLCDGSDKLSQGMDKLSEGSSKIKEEGLKSLDDILAVKDELVSLSEGYKTFSGADEKMDTDVKFIMKTDEIKIPEVKKEEVKADEKAQKKTFFQWLLSIF